ncbi:MAG: xylan 1,4-beta-xylosidase [Clostridiales bacterium]|nr:xylan 1,4-beta-xylosidase [Clostridiales bacterium]
MKTHTVRIDENSRAALTNNAMYCVGTGRMGLALQEEYQDQLRLCRSLAPFTFIRGHGLFCDDMAIYRPWQDETGVWHEGYNFTYLDRVMDKYLRMGIKPFLELGFMPQQMASGAQTIFYWKGNTTPPADEEKWTGLVKATLTHLCERYGYQEVAAWPCEVWNEPNLPGFWENADKQKYLRLYEITSQAVREAVPDMKVGGPAICGGSGSLQWIKDFLTFCRDKKLPLDFVTRHAYMGQTTQKKGRYTYHEMCDVAYTYDEMVQSRQVIDSFPEYAGMDMHITEFNTSYNPMCPIHDTNLNAAYIAGLLSCLGDICRSYSYWTFGDVFEEIGVPSLPFHGGFGMIANQLIVKPTMWTFHYFGKLQGDCVHRDDKSVIVKNADGSYEGVCWNLCRDGRDSLTVDVTLPLQGEYTLLTSLTDEECCNPLKVWHDMGQPASLTDDQVAFLRTAANPHHASCVIGENQPVSLTLGANGVCYFKLSPRKMTGEYGYEYEWYREHC